MTSNGEQMEASRRKCESNSRSPWRSPASFWRRGPRPRPAASVLRKSTLTPFGPLGRRTRRSPSGTSRTTFANRRWSTKLIRPPEGYTSKLKRRQLREYGDTVHQTRAELVNPSTGKVDTTLCVPHSDNLACYEEDHLIPLEDGGNPTDPRNLCPRTYNTDEGKQFGASLLQWADAQGVMLANCLAEEIQLKANSCESHLVRAAGDLRGKQGQNKVTCVTRAVW